MQIKERKKFLGFLQWRLKKNILDTFVYYILNTSVCKDDVDYLLDRLDDANLPLPLVANQTKKPLPVVPVTIKPDEIKVKKNIGFRMHNAHD